MFHFDGFGGMCGENSYNVFLLMFMILLWALIFATFCMRALLMLWHALLLLGLRHVGLFPPFSFSLGGFHFFSLQKLGTNYLPSA
jgi:hypothetical protein